MLVSPPRANAHISQDVRAAAHRRVESLACERPVVRSGPRRGRGESNPGVEQRGGVLVGSDAGSFAEVRDRIIDRLPLALRCGRIRLERSAATAVVVVALLGVVVAVGGWWRARPQGVAAPQGAIVAATPTPTPASVVVDMQGRVRRPGIVRLPAGSRVVDALAAAGGATGGASTATLNLARVLTDGEQLFVGVPPSAGAPPAGAPSAGVGSAAGPAATGPGALLDLNSATLEQLDGLPGVGPVLAQRIIDFRTEHGRFTAVDELQEVPGIGPAKYASLERKVRV